MSGNPQPIVTPGTYQINIASLTLTSSSIGLGETAVLSDQRYNVKATFSTHTPTSSSDTAVQDFTLTIQKQAKLLQEAIMFHGGIN